MATIAFKVKVIKSPDGTTATLAEVDAIDATTIQEFQHVMDKLIERGVKNLVLDCSNIKYINSTGLGTLLKYADTFESIGGHIAFCRVPSKVMLVMEMLGFNALFNVVNDEATALRSFAGKMTPPPSAALKPARASLPTPTPGGQKAVAPPPTPPPVAFPMQLPCARCRVTLEIASAGKYKCPRCNAVLAVEQNGRARFFASKKARPLALSIPANLKQVECAIPAVIKCATQAGFSVELASQIGQAVADACKNCVERAYENDAASLLHMLVSAEPGAVTIKIADYGKPFDFGPGGTVANDFGFEPVVKIMDTVEHRINPRGGNMLTLIKTQS